MKERAGDGRGYGGRNSRGNTIGNRKWERKHEKEKEMGEET